MKLLILLLMISCGKTVKSTDVVVLEEEIKCTKVRWLLEQCEMPNGDICYIIDKRSALSCVKGDR